MGFKSIINSRDGHIYYVVENGEEKRVYVGVFYLNHYEDLNGVAGEPGLWFVRDAAADDTGQHGDPTVHQGWAMYTWDSNKKIEGQTKTGGWYKVAEQESVDGPWGIDEKILKQLVTRTEYNLKIADVEARILVVEDRSTSNAQKINDLTDAVDELNRLKHWHENLDVLDNVNDVNGQLTYEGTPISGNTFVYDNVSSGKLYWKDPTDASAEAVEVANSKAIATAFVQTSMAWAGMKLQVMEVDGSFTTFVVIKDPTNRGLKRVLSYVSQIKSDRKYYDKKTNGEEIVYEEVTAARAREILETSEEGHDLYFDETALAFITESTNINGSYGSVIFVDNLPTASAVYDGRGIWYPLYDDGVYAPKNFYYSQDGAWINVASLNGPGSVVGRTGATFTASYCEDDPQMPFKKNHLFWEEPSDDASIKAWWSQTTLVRKFGSAPQNVNDGDQIMTTSSRTLGTTGYTDTCVYSNEPVYYRLFSTSRTGGSFICSAAVSPEPITWDKFYELATAKMLTKIFKVGDTIVLPKHPIFGMIECEVISVDEATDSVKGSITVATKEELGYLAFGSTNDYDSSDLKTWMENNFNLYTSLVLTEDGIAQPGIVYYTFDGKFTPLSITAGTALPEGVDVYVYDSLRPEGLFTSKEIPSSSTTGYENITKVKYHDHLNEETDWWTKDISGTNVKTGNEETVAPTEKLGAVVVFTLQEA